MIKCSGCIYKHEIEFRQLKSRGHTRDRCKQCCNKDRTKARQNAKSKGLCRCGSPRALKSTKCINCIDAAKQYQSANLGKISSYNRKAYVKLKIEVINAYGGKCACCHETTFEFLTLDHINNDGADHRRKVGGYTRKVWSDLKKNGFPPIMQVLCANCHLAKTISGECPHKKEG